jgi:7,8-dihydro-6-hydroxymethylpterin-pyrophosphokinase
MESSAALRQRAERYRRMALAVTDRLAIQALNELAATYEAQAKRLETKQKNGPSTIKD